MLGDIECSGFMHEVTCFHCRTVVQIAPDDDHCSNCGEDLRGLLPPEQISDYFCTRVAELAGSGRREEALSEAERGLTFHNVAELHLLAAMLAEGLQRYDVMRGHVAAIPLDDSLRTEAEWLLRAHQERQRALREGEKHGHGSRQPAGKAISIADILGQPAAPAPPQRFGTQFWTGAAAILIVAILFGTWFARGQQGSGVAGQPATNGGAVSDQSATAIQPAEPAASQAGQAAPVATTVDDSGIPAQVQSTDVPPEQAMPSEGQKQTEPVQTERLLPIPTPSVPKDLVVPADEGEAIVDSNPRSVVVLRADGFDLKRVLRENGLPELAALPIDARLQDGKLILNGLIHLDLQRRQILEVLETVPGINEVSVANLLLRPNPTYTVQPGDTLWSIVYDIYGDPNRVEEFYRANLDIAPSPDALRVGDELRVPPIN